MCGNIGSVADDAVLLARHGFLIQLAALNGTSISSMEQSICRRVDRCRIIGNIRPVPGSVSVVPSRDLIPGIADFAAVFFDLLFTFRIFAIQRTGRTKSIGQVDGIIVIEIIFQIRLMGRRTWLNTQLRFGIIYKAVELA